MGRTLVAVMGTALLGLGMAMFGAGTAQAAPQDCVITRDLIGASATCHDTDAPRGREYTLIVECFGLHPIPNAFPFMAFGPYEGSWGGWFTPTGHGSATCLDGLSVGTTTGAHVAIYVN